MVAMTDGFQLLAGWTWASSATLRGPTRRSRSGAIERRQLAAARLRSASVIDTCASFSASANVAEFTGGPDVGPVPKVGGAPGVVVAGGGDGDLSGDCCPLQAAETPSKPAGAAIKNCLRVFISDLVVNNL
jgi:hypothetical protein